MSVPSFKRRMACLLYDALLLIAVLFLASFVVVGLLPDVRTGLPRALFQTYLTGVAGLYFSVFWSRGGQTLAMKTWRIRLIKASGGSVGMGMAWLRYGLAMLGLFCFGFGYYWALWDKDRQFLHDHLLGTRLVLD